MNQSALKSASGHRTRRASLILALALGAALMILSAGASSARAASDLTFSTFAAGGFNADGSPSTQAGAHPWELASSFQFGTINDPDYGVLPDAAVRSTVFDLPAGVIGDPQVVPQCREGELAFTAGACPRETQVGYADVDRIFFSRGIQRSPVYNVVPGPGEAAAFRFVVTTSVVHVSLKVRSDGDYGVVATATGLNAAAAVFGVELHLWGVPADPSHDAYRFDPVYQTPSPGPSGMPPTPFLRNPTSCTGPVTTTLRATSWSRPDQVVTAQAPAPAVTGCSRVPFAPTLAVRPDTAEAASAAGFRIDLDVPQNQDPNGLASADLRKAVVTLPAGVAVNPGAADGLRGCADTQFALRSGDADSCPDRSVIGTTKITTPLLSKPLEGRIYLAEPLDQSPAGAAAGDMLRVFLEAHGVGGVQVKLAGSAVPDPVTGQLKAIFDNNPQLPFTNLQLDFNGGPRAPLALPKACGSYTTHSEFTSWASNVPVESDSSFVISQNCDQAGKFEPALTAGVINPAAGGSSPFTMTLSRPDGQQDFRGLALTLPTGLLGNVGSVPLCPEAQAAAGSCSSASQVGKAKIAAGAGTSPLWVPQAGKSPTAVFLAGPYQGAPFSLVVVVPAQAGPFDLGRVTVRAAVRVDPVDAHVTVASDPIPTILNGVPLNVQKINVTIERPGFMRNPTDCTPTQIAGTLISTEGLSADVAGPFNIAGCAALALRPKLALALSGKGQTVDGKHPAVTASLSQAAGQANLKRVRVTLPLSVALDPDNAESDGLCSFVEGSKVDPKCPASSVVGSVTATTPVLDGPLTGPVYFVKNERKDRKSGRSIRTLPKLVIPLVGQNGVRVVLTGTSDVVDNHLVSTFDAIPDAPVSSFKLTIAGGKKGILVISGDKADICKANQIADQQIDGQNGKAADADIIIQTPSCALKVISKKITKATVALKVGGLGAGKVTVTGSGIKKTTKTIANATVATITAHRTKARLGKVKVSFTPAGAKKAKTTTTTLP